jgi:PAS domain S-box-containing protein
VIVKNFGDFWKPDTKKHFQENFTQFKKKGFIDNAEITLVKKNGEYLTIILTGKIQYGKDGKFEKTHCTIVDISKRKQLEETLKENEKKYKSIFENVQDVYYESTIDGTILELSPSISIFSKGQYKREDLIGKSVFGIYSDPEERQKLLSDLLEKGRVTDFEITLKNRNGSVGKGSIASKISFDEKGKPEKIIGSIHDISERKIAEEKLKTSEKEYRNLFELANDSIIIFEPENEIILDVNSRACKTYGFTKEEFIGMSLKKISKNVELGEKKIKEILENRQLNNFETVHLKKDGSLLSILVSATAIEYKGQKAIQSLNLDISERKRIEEAVKESEERFRKLTETASDAIISIDNNGKIISWNESSARIFDYTNYEILGKNVDIIIPQKYWSSHKNGLKELSNGREPKMFGKTIKIEAVRKDKTVFPIELSLSSWESSNSVFYTAIIRDISERVKAEEELSGYRDHLEELVKSRTEELDKVNEYLRIEIEKDKEYELMLQNSLQKEIELNEIKSRFISTTSHEFRTPLTSVLSSTELLQRYSKKWSEEKLNVHFERIKSSIKYLVGLLDDVLTLSRAERGKIILNPGKVDLKKLVEEYIEDASALAKNHKIDFNYRSRTAEYSLDPKLLKFMFSNLLSNAIKYSPNGGNIALDVSTDKKHLIIAISDEGIGIPESEIEFIFQSFYRSKNAEEIPGTGLGLSIVKLAVDLHGGEIFVDSEIGKGSKFTVKIPK